ncbi:MAG TPA: FAD-binding oxidoreductase [Candidatus Deferrimicrobium sp.]|nr:FAD-binding oxidoreductase [Candidatus Deferrimicrobium sp.]
MDKIHDKLVEIIGETNVISDKNLLDTYFKRYSEDFLIKNPIKPKLVVYVKNNEEIMKILKIANEFNFSVVPISSQVIDANGAEAPYSENTILLDLTRMDQILVVDLKNRMCMIEPGVTFKQLIPVANEVGLRLLMPLMPSSGKSVLTSALEREPIILPRYHWDASDPLLCTEVVFGTGDLFRTGTAAGPGTIEEQRASGQAQKNPLGPTQFDPFRIIQGAQGSIGIVTWISLKCELLPDTRKILYIQSENLEKVIEFLYVLLKRRFGDELFIVNNLTLASLLRTSHDEINKLQSNIPSWTLIIGVGGRGPFAKDKIEFLEAELGDIARDQGIQLLSEIKNVSNDEIIRIFQNCADNPWRLRYLGGSQEIFFITTLDKTPQFISSFKKMVEAKKFSLENIGIYIQPLVQGCNCHCEFDIYYKPSDNKMKENARTLFEEASVALMEQGAFFSRPYGIWADEVYKRISPIVVTALQKVKGIFDPKNVLHPGTLCFKEERA